MRYVLKRPSMVTEYTMPSIIRGIPTGTGLYAGPGAAIVAAHTTTD